MAIELSVQFNKDCQFVGASKSAWSDALKVHVGLAIGCLHVLCLGLWFLVPRRLWRPAGLLLALATGGGMLWLARSRRENDEPLAWMSAFLGSVFGFQAFFKNLAVSNESFPEGADKDMKTWVLWYTNFPEPCVAKGNLVKAASRSTIRQAGLATVKLGIMIMLLSTSANQENIRPLVVSGSASAAEDFFVELLTNYIQLWWIYLWLSFCLDLGALVLMIHGYATEPPFANPLLSSRSYRECWGERWNRPVHLLLKRSVYKPLRRMGARPLVSSCLTFAASGILHEYTFFIHNYRGYHFGYAFTFFLAMGALMSAEGVIPWPSFARKFAGFLPVPVWAILMQLPIVTIFAPLFFNSWIESGHLNSVSELLPHWECPASPLLKTN